MCYARLQDKIGEGKFSQVYKCQGKVDHVFYAAKVLKKAEMDEEDLTALVDEVRIMKMVFCAHSEAHTPAALECTDTSIQRSHRLHCPPCPPSFHTGQPPKPGQAG